MVFIFVIFISKCAYLAALKNGALRMVNTGNTQFGGRLEFYYNREWGTICDNGWDPSDASVACRQLGFSRVSDSDSSLFGSGASSQTIWLAGVVCSGSESRLIDCNFAAIDTVNHICTHSEDVGVVCTNTIGEVWVYACIHGLLHDYVYIYALLLLFIV